LSAARDKPTARRREAVGVRRIAQVAGVSTATVSRAINNPKAVSEGLRARISSVITELGWVPSGAARALAMSRTHTIGAVFPALALGDFARAIDALQDELDTRSYTLLLARSRYSAEQEHRQVVKLIERGVDGLVLVGKTRTRDLDLFLERRQVPFVNTFVYAADSAAPCIGPNNFRAMFEMADYLIGLGHQRFGVIAQSSVNNDRAGERRDGVHAALSRRGIVIPPQHELEGRWSIEEGRKLFRCLLGTRPWPTAVICGNSLLAAGALLESQQLGVAVPEDMSIVGYDDIEIMRELPIPITTVRVASDKVGETAGAVIVDMIEGRHVGGGIEIPFEIIPRRSSGPPPRQA
jgi:LacI family transcriptional regulator